MLILCYQIVHAASASFMNEPAVKLLERDHHTVCKFENALGDYEDVESALAELLAAVTNLRIVPEAPNMEEAATAEVTATAGEAVNV